MVTQIFQICIIPLLGILTKYVVDFLNAKRLEIKQKTDSELAEKYTDMVIDTVTTCVIATNQTYVESLKQTGSFNKEAQEQAFQMTLDAVLATLSEEAKKYIKEITGDIDTYLTQLIEAEVNQCK